MQSVDHFEPYGPSHWALMGLIIVGSVLVAVAGRRWHGVWFGRWFAIAVLAFNVPLLIFRQLPGEWDIAESLPLHLCDIGWMVAAYALWTGGRHSYAVTYYWGLTLTPQAIITPALDSPDFPHINFIEFWGQHLLIIWAAAYLTWGARMRPDWRGYWFSLAVTVVWGVSMMGFNALAGTNYGFVNDKPENPSLLDLMGGWPWYLLVALIVGMIGWALLTWPWTRRPAEVKAS